MNAIGGELGWLTWPLDQGDRPGVSIAPSSTVLTFMFLLRTRLWVNLHSDNAQQWPEQQTSGPQTFSHLTHVASR